MSGLTVRMEPWYDGLDSSLSRQEWEETRLDLDWWADLADRLECRVMGWTWRNHASFVLPTGECQEVSKRWALVLRKALGLPDA